MGNRGNFCYMNALLKCLLHVSCHVGQPYLFFKSHAKSFIAVVRRARAGKVFHIWQAAVWRTMIQGWGAPMQQHDLAEFLLFIAGKPWFAREEAELVWQSKACPEGSADLQITDGGSSIPLLLPPLGTASSGVDPAVSVQHILEQWHNQKNVHAAVFPPRVVILQASRFDYDVEGQVARKLRYSIHPDRVVSLPVFTAGLSVH